jgi:HD-GYP domain-containing protein (c-di-GMP phosphodiesterase class II)
MVKARERTVLEKHLSSNASWQAGYLEFTALFGKPIGWLYLLRDDGNQLIRIDRKAHCSFFGKINEQQELFPGFPEGKLVKFAKNPEETSQFPIFYSKSGGKSSAVFAVKYIGRLKAVLALGPISKPEDKMRPYLGLFNRFLQLEAELAYRTFELQNFYETVHPRALALSTIHSVHRAMALSTGLSELLPRIGRLCSQVLKAKRCGVYLLDATREHLELKFALGEKKEKRHRIRMGQGIEGHVADTAEFHISRSCVCVPFIEDDVVGVVVLREKIDGTAFSRTDLEILKTLSEQAVIAIKNAQLFEETERLTVGSIKTINELLELSFSGDNIHLPLFSEIAFEIGKDMGLSGEGLTNLHRATFLIDAGHLGTPEHILRKTERLTEHEYEEVKRHPSKGAAILEQIEALRPVIPIILHHHERFDGTGYPGKLKGDQIPIGGRIVSVVDSFTAMLSRRPYRKVRSTKQAVEEIKSLSGKQFDPDVVESFLRVIKSPALAQKLNDLGHKNGEPMTRGSEDAHSA